LKVQASIAIRLSSFFKNPLCRGRNPVREFMRQHAKSQFSTVHSISGIRMPPRRETSGFKGLNPSSKHRCDHSRQHISSPPGREDWPTIREEKRPTLWVRDNGPGAFQDDDRT
jgi:hypothetical protein